MPKPDLGERLQALDIQAQNNAIGDAIFISLSGWLCLSAALWSLLCLHLGAWQPALLLGAYVLVSALGYSTLHGTPMGTRTRAVQMGLNICWPFMVQPMLGGALQSGSIMFWTFAGLCGSLTFRRVQQSTFWAAIVLVLTPAYILFDPVLPLVPPERLASFPDPVLLACFNVVGASLLIFGMAYRFTRIQGSLRKRNHAMREILAEMNDGLALRNAQVEQSLSYAGTIQQGLLPDLRSPNGLVHGGMVLYKAKDHVGGDLYWQGSHGGQRMFATMDCTGHGVPGALLTLLVHDLLNEVVLTKGITDPAEVVRHVVGRIPSILRQQEADLQDGVEMAVVRIDTEGGKHAFTGYGANLLLRTPQRTTCHSGQLAKARIQGPCDLQHLAPIPLDLQPGTRLYLHTDGIVHQPGGPEGRKFSRARLERSLVANSHLPWAEQEERLSNALSTWMADQDQVDDILVIGFEPVLTAIRSEELRA